MCNDWRKRQVVFESNNLKVTLTRADNLVQRRVAVCFGTEQDWGQMWQFLQ